MTQNDCVELRQLANTVADITVALGGIHMQMAAQNRLMWARLVEEAGSWEMAANCYLWGLKAASKVQRVINEEGGGK